MAKLSIEMGLPWVLSLAGAIAGIFGYLIAKPTLRLPGIYLTLVTLGFNMILFLVLQNWMSFTNGPLGIMDIPPPSLFSFVATSRLHYYYLILILVLLTVFSKHRLMGGRLGRALTAIRENELAAEATGVNTCYGPIQALKNVSLTVDEKEIVSLFERERESADGRLHPQRHGGNPGRRGAHACLVSGGEGAKPAARFNLERR
jgi:ABC-type uncharacterized transport system permease subunit